MQFSLDFNGLFLIFMLMLCTLKLCFIQMDEGKFLFEKLLNYSDYQPGGYQGLLLLNKRARRSLCCHMEMQLAPRCSLDSLQPSISMSSLLSNCFRVDWDTDRSTPLTRCLAHAFLSTGLCMCMKCKQEFLGSLQVKLAYDCTVIDQQRFNSGFIHTMHTHSSANTP